MKTAFETPADQGTSTDHRSERDAGIGAMIRAADDSPAQPVEPEIADHYAPDAPPPEAEQATPESQEAPETPEGDAAAPQAPTLTLEQLQQQIAQETKRREDTQAAYTQGQQELAAMRAQIEQLQQPAYAPPLGAFHPSSVDELIAGAERDPKQAAMWVLSQQEGTIELDLAEAVVSNWADKDPVGYRRWEMAETQAAQAAILAPLIEPVMEVQANTTAMAARELALQTLPDFAKHAPAIQAALEANPQLMTQDAYRDPQQMVAVWAGLYYQEVGREWAKGAPAREEAAKKAAAEAKAQEEAEKAAAMVEGEGSADPAGGVRGRLDDKRPPKHKGIGQLIRTATPDG